MTAAPPFYKPTDTAPFIDRMIGDEYYTVKKVASFIPALELAIANNTGATVSSLYNLPNVDLPSNVKVVVTGGLLTSGLGGAVYVDATGETLPSDGQGIWWNTSKDGRKFKLSPDEVVTPAKFGAPLNGVNDDAIAIQKAVDYVNLVRLQGSVDLEGRRYRCLSRIVTNTTRSYLKGGGALLDFSSRTFPDPSSMPELSPDPEFTSSAGWIAGLQSSGVDPWTITGGQAVRDQAGVVPHFVDFGRQMPLVRANKRYRFTFEIASLGTVGDFTYAMLRCVDGVGGPANNGLAYGSGLQFQVQATGVYTTEFTCPATVPAGGAWVGFQTSNKVSINYLSIQEIPDNECLLDMADSSSTQYGNDHLGHENFYIKGPGKTGFSTGVKMNTLVTNKSSRRQWRNVSVDGHAIGLKLANRAYLIDFYGCAVWNCGTCVETTPNPADAGEQIGFYGCVLFNSDLAVRTDGQFWELRFYGGSWDFCKQWYKGLGGVELFGVHLEKQAPTTSIEYPIHLTGAGDFKMHGGRILGGTGWTADYFFYGESKFSHIILNDVDGYGWTSASGELMGGLGRLMIGGKVGWGSIHAIAPITKNDTIHNLFADAGRFESSTIGLTAWVGDGGSGREAVPPTVTGPYAYSTGGAGTGNGTVTIARAFAPVVPGIWQIQFTAATTFNVRDPAGRLDGTGVTGTTYDGGIQVRVIASSTPFINGDSFRIAVSADMRSGIYYRNNTAGAYGSQTMSITNVSPITGSQSLKLTKIGIGVGVGSRYYVAAPLKPKTQATLKGTYTVPAYGADGTSRHMFIQVYFARLVGYDALGIPILGPELQLVGDVSQDFAASVGKAATTFTATSLIAEAGSGSDGVSPDWANILLLQIDAFNFPEGFTMLLDDLGAWSFG